MLESEVFFLFSLASQHANGFVINACYFGFVSYPVAEILVSNLSDANTFSNPDRLGVAGGIAQAQSRS
ncbi:hypothetical protein [Nostoc sp. FACHB-110]|uniref:hypothetical protein n=1 Tax=Nostoc sp. FACHB-110 TaxID=2692834 RepID=UPI00168A2775|nr:hypothetical protein [Nostoc sp. FACHB-110]